MFEFDVARRRFLGVGGVALSGTAVALLAGRDVLAAAEKAANPANDVAILNSALAAELAGTVKRLGGTPAEAKAKYSFPVETLKTQNDVLRFAGNLEKGAVSAYLGAVPLFKDRELAKAAASILGDEAMHWAVLRQAVGEEPVPAAFVS